ncbi:LacI family DNA-binding transcriptional regulator [Cohnella cellulosilytica]|uniref:LacI family DNA-binding transcriptional regulator n=1 Tax=Cohnella cellulosilytica TaxID=986710 RepID=A0ABW2F7H7_9BACL
MTKVTQQDIANALNISRITVSKALNGGSGVREESRRHILAKAQEMGYQLPAKVQEALGESSNAPSARKLISLFTLSGGNTGSFWSKVVDGMVNVLVSQGYDMNICFLELKEHETVVLPGNFLPDLTDGIVTLGNFERGHIEKIKELGLPVVSVDTVTDANEYRLMVDTIMLCNEQPITEIASRLIRDGHRKIGYVGEKHTCRSFRERWLGFRRAMEKAELPIDLAYCFISEGSRSLTAEAIVEGIRKMEVYPTAFVCANDFAAVNVIQALREKGLRVPDDIAVSGFDNVSEAQLLDITSVDSFKTELGMRAAEEIIWRIGHPERPYEMIRTPTRVVYRGSTNWTNKESEDIT